MSASAARIEANRANAALSTGPRTPEGKHRAALNAIRHGLTSQQNVIPGEDPQVYQEFCRTLIADLRPKGALEEQLARTMADTQWRLNRCRSIEQIILAAEPDRDVFSRQAVARFQRHQIESLNKFSMYEQRLTRTFQSTLKQFRELQAERVQRETQEKNDAAAILKHCRANQLPFDPAAHGFVFTTPQLDAWTRRQEILHQAIPGDLARPHQC